MLCYTAESLPNPNPCIFCLVKGSVCVISGIIISPAAPKLGFKGAGSPISLP